MTSLFHISELGVRLKKGGAVCQARGQVGRKQAGAGAGGIQVRRRRVSVAQGGMLESEGDALGPLARFLSGLPLAGRRRQARRDGGGWGGWVPSSSYQVKGVRALPHPSPPFPPTLPAITTEPPQAWELYG